MTIHRPALRPTRRRAAVLTAAVAAAAAVALSASPASAAYDGGYGDAWVTNQGTSHGKGYDGSYGDGYGKGYDGSYGDAWVNRHVKNGAKKTPADSTPAAKTAKLRVTASGPGHLAHNASGRYIVELTNTGDGAAEGARLSTTMPHGITYLAHRVSEGSASEELTGDGRIVLTVGRLEAGQTVRLEIAGRAPSHGGGTVRLHATGTTGTPGAGAADTTATVSTRIG
ncbi:hypothetical protein [Streptomyces sp. cmx-4-9]|uniref:hypothetical protein n=1 Tax=Streptomyces sp. cmx-4-9 TaxID=2790941 RepID=UPI00397F009A